MGETDLHREEMTAAIEALADYFRDDPMVYVAGNLMFYYEEGHPSAVMSPDVMVVKGVKRGRRRTYKLWQEGRAPDVVIEFTSRSSRLEDLGTKRALYAILGVKEYFLFDPLDEYLEPPFQGFRLNGTEYEHMALEPDGSLVSRELQLRLKPEPHHLRLLDLATGAPLLTPAEAQDARRQAENARRQAENARRQAENARHDLEHQLQSERQKAHARALRGFERELELRFPALAGWARGADALSTEALEALADTLAEVGDETGARALLAEHGLPRPLH